MEKFLITINQDDVDDIKVEYDDPTYDGTETRMGDPDGVYHITAKNEFEAVEAAKFLDSMGNPAYCEGALYEGH